MIHGHFVPFARPERWIVRNVAVLLSALAVRSTKTFRRKLVAKKSLTYLLVFWQKSRSGACRSWPSHVCVNNNARITQSSIIPSCPIHSPAYVDA